MTAAEYQKVAVQGLARHFQTVEEEWSVGRDSTDGLRYGVTYAPRFDIAVGPFNTRVGDAPVQSDAIYANRDHPAIRRIIGQNRRIEFNPNPRCLLAIEIEFSGSSKHILGDFTNASMMGLVGVVVVPRSKFHKASRIYRYIEFIKTVHKAPTDLFGNLILFETDQFLAIIE